MAKRKKRPTTRRTASASRKVAPQNLKSLNLRQNSIEDWLDELKLNESYISLLLGAVVVLVLSAVFFVFIRESSFEDTSSFPKTQNIPAINQLQPYTTYVLQPGEGLWDVAVRFYGDGYKWIDIAKANNLTEEQANALGPGARLIIPNVK